MTKYKCLKSRKICIALFDVCNVTERRNGKTHILKLNQDNFNILTTDNTTKIDAFILHRIDQ